MFGIVRNQPVKEWSDAGLAVRVPFDSRGIGRGSLNGPGNCEKLRLPTTTVEFISNGPKEQASGVVVQEVQDVSSMGGRVRPMKVRSVIHIQNAPIAGPATRR